MQLVSSAVVACTDRAAFPPDAVMAGWDAARLEAHASLCVARGVQIPSIEAGRTDTQHPPLARKWSQQIPAS
eukprot:2478674-Prymnesium_polylepis.2